MNDSTLSEMLSDALGKTVNVSTEFGLAVYDLETMECLLSLSKVGKKISIDWICDKIESKDKEAQARKEKREKYIKIIRDYMAEKGLNVHCGGASVYPTTFGFSVCNLFQDGLSRAKALVDELGIEYKRMEYSDAHWVVRIVL